MTESKDNTNKQCCFPSSQATQLKNPETDTYPWEFEYPEPKKWKILPMSPRLYITAPLSTLPPPPSSSLGQSATRAASSSSSSSSSSSKVRGGVRRNVPTPFRRELQKYWSNVIGNMEKKDK